MGDRELFPQLSHAGRVGVFLFQFRSKKDFQVIPETKEMQRISCRALHSEIVFEGVVPIDGKGMRKHSRSFDSLPTSNYLLLNYFLKRGMPVALPF